MSNLHRAQILLETEQHEALVEIAEREGRSISDVVREIIRIHLRHRKKKQHKYEALQALEGLAAIRAKVREEHGVYEGDFIRETRDEREDDIERIWRGDE